MNERLKELYLQAHSIRHYDNDPSLAGNPPTVYWQGETSAQRFAELIVQECMEQVWYSREDGINGNVSEVIKDRIKKHFGVEE